MWRKSTKSQTRAEILDLLSVSLKAKKACKITFQVHVPREHMKECNIRGRYEQRKVMKKSLKFNLENV